MSPPIHKDWWLAAALTGAALPTAMGQTVANAGRQQTGVVTTVTQGAPTTTAPLYIESASGQKLTTGPSQTLHVLFSDQSALTVGPNSQVVITDYKFNSQTKDGNLLIDMTKGLLRVVGGFISKKTETVVRTNTATVGIRGGISIIEHQDNNTTGVFLFGQYMSVSGVAGETSGLSSGDPGTHTGLSSGTPPAQLIMTPGFGFTGSGGPQRMPSSLISNFLHGLGATGGSTFNPATSSPNAPGNSRGAGLLGQISNDRLSNRINTLNNANLTQSVRTILGNSGQANQS